MKITDMSASKKIVAVGNTSLFLYEIGGHLTIQSTDEHELLRFKKGSLSFRTSKGMKLKHAIKDLISKGKGSTTEIILINVSD